jgi:3'(2'), 5'-bisphosphate nucleotidase
MNISQLNKFLNEIFIIIKHAGVVLKDYFNQDNINVEKKTDGSSVTDADLTLDSLIRNYLNKKFPSIPIISEESGIPPLEERSQWQQYWLIDPLDGTQEFINKNKWFSINIALIQHGLPVLGVIYFPLLETIYFGGIDLGSFKQINNKQKTTIKTRKLNSQQIIAISNIDQQRSKNTNLYLKKLVDKLENTKIIRHPGSIKFCMLAEGQADILPKLDRVSEWDLAASQAIIEGAGGVVLDKQQHKVVFNQNTSILAPEFFAIADPKKQNLFFDTIDLADKSARF